MVLIGWYSKFIPNFADRAGILTDLTRASAPNKVMWTNECDRAFIDFKVTVTTEFVLHTSDFFQPFTLQMLLRLALERYF